MKQTNNNNKSTYQLLYDLLDQLTKLHLWVCIVQVLDQLGDHFRVRVRLERESFVLLLGVGRQPQMSQSINQLSRQALTKNFLISL